MSAIPAAAASASASPGTSGTDTFPRQYARTRRLSLGEPRSVTVTAGGERVLFLRSRGGSDPVTCLWALDLPAGVERVVADPLPLLAGADADLPPEERARRERMREQADGITGYAVDGDGQRAVFSLNGRLHVVDTAPGSAAPRALVSCPGAFDPRLSPDGTKVAYIADQALRIAEVSPVDGVDPDRVIANDEHPDISWGVPDFVAAEELDRFRGFWWSPTGDRLAVACVDNRPVQRWWIADPANPGRKPAVHAYPAAGTANADVTLWLVDPADGARQQIVWDRESFPYLVHVTWPESGLVVVVMDRAQRNQRTLAVSAAGVTSTLMDVRDDVWVERTMGLPLVLASGDVLTTVDAHVSVPQPAGLPDATDTGMWDDPEGTRALAVFAGTGHRPRPVTPANLHVRKVIRAHHGQVLLAVTASRPVPGVAVPADPACISVVSVPLDGGPVTVLAGGIDDPGVHDATADGSSDVLVIRSASLGRLRADHRVVRMGADGVVELARITNHAEAALGDPQPRFMRAGPRAVPMAVLLPSDPALNDPLEKLPVLLDPYGGPHAQRVVASRNAWASSQWLADQGFAVVVIDGRGTPGMGPEFERAVHNDLAGPVLEDQITGLHRAAEEFPQLDLSRVAIRGWSFGGYLAALAVLRRPDVFHAAVAGAPVTDWRLYDTGYTERYLGHPDQQPGVYDQSSLLLDAPHLTRPLMIIHGLADDNVVSAHTLRLSSALLAAGRPHEVLPLSGVTHMTPQEVVAENLLLLQVDFLRRALALK